MQRDARFWVLMIVFQAEEGLVVFTATRNHYLSAPAEQTAAVNPNRPPKFEPFYAPLHDDPCWLAFRERTGTSEAQLAAIEFEVTLPE